MVNRIRAANAQRGRLAGLANDTAKNVKNGIDTVFLSNTENT